MRQILSTIAALGLLAASAFVTPVMALDQGRDYTFKDSGEASYRYASDSSDEALRIFPSMQSYCNEGGCFANGVYYVAGHTRAAGSTKSSPAILTLDYDGNPITGIGENGWLISPAHLDTVDDVAYDPLQGRMYFVGTDYSLGAAVICMNISTGNLCSGFGIGGGGMTAFAFGNGYTSFGDRILFDAELGLLVSGVASKDSGDGDWLGVARLSATTGARISAFSSDGRRLYSNSPRPEYGNRMYVNAMALAPGKDSSGRRRLYVGGSYRLNPEIHDSFDGFVLAINGESSNGIGNFGGPGTAWLPVRYEYPYFGNMKDSVTALTVLANGKLAVLGWTEQMFDGDSSLTRTLMFARFESNGTRDSSFCPSSQFNNVINACDAIQHNYWRTADSRYAAILERPDNRDLIYFYTKASQSNLHSQQVLQSSASAETLHAGTYFYAGAIANGLPARAYGAAWDWIGHSRAVYVGSKKRSDSNSRWEFTVVRVWTDDTIFADTLGGPHSD